MKHICFTFILVNLISAAFGQQPAKADETLLLEYYQSQRFADAADYLKKTYPEPVTDTKALTQLAYTSQMAGKLADAEGYYQRIYDRDSTNITVLFNLGAINIRAPRHRLLRRQRTRRRAGLGHHYRSAIPCSRHVIDATCNVGSLLIGPSS